MVLLGEVSVRGLVIRAYSDHFCTEILERFVGVPEAAGFCRTALGEVFRIEVDDKVFLSKKIRQRNVTAIAGWQMETRCVIANSDQPRHIDMYEPIGEEEVFAAEERAKS